MWFWIRSVCQESKRAGFPENQIPVPCKRNCKQEPGSSCNSLCAAREKREKRQGDGNRNGMDGPGNFPASGEGGSGAEAEAVPGSRKRNREKWWHADTDRGQWDPASGLPSGLRQPYLPASKLIFPPAFVLRYPHGIHALQRFRWRTSSDMPVSIVRRFPRFEVSCSPGSASGSRLWKPPPIFPRHPTPILSRQAIMIRRLQVVSARQLPLYLRREAVRAGFSEGITGASRFLRFCDIFS